MKGNKYYISILNIVSCFSVVVLHQNYMVHQFSPTREWAFSVMLEVLFYFAVPVFFMLTGATLIGYERKYSNSVFAKKRIKKTLIPYLIFSLFGFFFAILRGGINHELSIKDILIGVLDSRFTTIYWFFIPLFYIYLLMPILTKVRFLQRNILLYLALILILLNQLPLINSFLDKKLLFSTNDLLGPVMYVLLGYYLSCYCISLKYKRIIYIIAFFCLIIHFAIMYYFSSFDGKVNYLLSSYFYITTIFPSISVFIFIKDFTPESIQKNKAKFISKLSSASLGVYLLHFYVITGEHYIFGHVVDSSLIFRIPSVIVTYIICLIIIDVIRKIPIMRYVIP